MSRCGPNKITLLVGAPKHDQRTMCVPAVRTNRYMMAGRLAAGAAAAVASSSAAASDMAVGSVYIIYKYWGRVLEQHVLPHGRAPTAPDGANFQTEKWTVFQVQQLHPSKYIYFIDLHVPLNPSSSRVKPQTIESKIPRCLMSLKVSGPSLVPFCSRFAAVSLQQLMLFDEKRCLGAFMRDESHSSRTGPKPFKPSTQLLPLLLRLPGGS